MRRQRRRRGRGGDDRRSGDDGSEDDRLRHDLVHRRLDRRRAEVVPGGARRLQGEVPGRERSSTTPAGDNIADRALDRGRGRQPAGHRGRRPAGPRARLRRPRARSSRSTSPRTRSSTNFGQSIVDVGTVDGDALRPVFKAANKSTVWYNVQAFKDAGVEPPTTWDELLDGRGHDQGVGHAGVLDRRRGRLDAHRPVREHLPPAGGPDEVRPAVDARDQVDRPVGQGRADDDGQGRRRHGQHRRRHVGRAADRLPDLGHERVLRQRRRPRW